jgi:hypothetical protein
MIPTRRAPCRFLILVSTYLILYHAHHHCPSDIELLKGTRCADVMNAATDQGGAGCVSCMIVPPIKHSQQRYSKEGSTAWALGTSLEGALPCSLRSLDVDRVPRDAPGLPLIERVELGHILV